MKKSILFLIVGTLTWGSYAQQSEETSEETTNLARHEIRVDVLEGLLVPALDVNYEYLISRRSGAGLAAYVALQDLETNDYQQWAIAPYYRQYFFSKEEYGGKGFFAEGLLQVAGGTYEEVFDIIDGSFGIQQESWTQFGIGFSFGQKWVNQNGFVVELSLGAGRYLGADKGPEAFFRGGALIGYRF
jgi:hypothetical protein